MIKIVDDEQNEVFVNPLKVLSIHKLYCTLEGGENIFFADEKYRQHLELGVTRCIHNMYPPDEIFVRKGD